MKTYIEARAINPKEDEPDQLIQVEIGASPGMTPDGVELPAFATEALALAEVRRRAGGRVVKFYRHICYHDVGGKPCEVIAL